MKAFFLSELHVGKKNMTNQDATSFPHTAGFQKTLIIIILG
jgi:hypothetical protein